MVFLVGSYLCGLQHNPSSWMHILSYSCFPSPFKPSWHTWPVFYCLYRFKPLQKVDGMSDSLCGSSQHCNSTPEQSVAAQSQHHQQYIGEGKTWLAATTTAVTLESEEWFKFNITSISFCCYGTGFLSSPPPRLNHSGIIFDHQTQIINTCNNCHVCKKSAILFLEKVIHEFHREVIGETILDNIYVAWWNKINIFQGSRSVTYTNNCSVSSIHLKKMLHWSSINDILYQSLYERQLVPFYHGKRWFRLSDMKSHT